MLQVHDQGICVCVHVCLTHTHIHVYICVCVYHAHTHTYVYIYGVSRTHTRTCAHVHSTYLLLVKRVRQARFRRHRKVCVWWEEWCVGVGEKGPSIPPLCRAECFASNTFAQCSAPHYNGTAVRVNVRCDVVPVRFHAFGEKNRRQYVQLHT